MSNFGQLHTELAKFMPRNARAGSYSLDRMQELMHKLGNPQEKFKVIHVAGTSGKTSTCYYLAALLQATGKKVGLTVSPHVDEVNERVQINLIPLPEQVFCQKLGQFIEIVGQTGLEPTYFELLIAFAYWQFAAEKVDYAVIEVGLGGLLDGTNVIKDENKVCVITDIGLDHINILGDTLAKIAAQKAGIIQSHNPVFMYRQSDEVMQPVIQRSEHMRVQLHQLTTMSSDTLPAYLPPFQQRNWYLAKTVIDFVAERDGLPALSDIQLANASHTRVPARLEITKYVDRTIIIDGSHNSQKMAALAEGIHKLFPGKSVAALVSFVVSEAGRAPGALEQLLTITDSLIITAFSGQQDTPKQSVDPKIIATTAEQLGFNDVSIMADPKEAFGELLKCPEDILLVTGSFYLLNHIRPLIFLSK